MKKDEEEGEKNIIHRGRKRKGVNKKRGKKFGAKREGIRRMISKKKSNEMNGMNWNGHKNL